MSQPNFCASTSENEGAWGLRQWTRIVQEKKKSKWDIALLALVFFFVLAQTTRALWLNPEPWLEPLVFWIATTLFSAMFVVHIYSAWISRPTILNRLLQIDLWVAALLIALAIENGIPSTSWISVLSIGSLSWYFLRSVEASLWNKRLRGLFKNENLKWTDAGLPKNLFLKLELYIGVFAIMISGIASYFFFDHFAPSTFIGAVLPGLLPWPSWIGTQTFASAYKLKAICRDFRKFIGLKNVELIALHQTGVLTTSEFKFKELWIDRNTDDFSESEIKDVLRQLSQINQHPVGECILSELGESNRVLMKMNASNWTPHLCIEGDFEDSKRHRASAVLSHLHWHKICQHEISEDGMEKIREWKREKYSTEFLALNRKVVAAVVWENPVRATDISANFATPLALISSQPQIADGIAEKIFRQTAVGLLPIERDLQIKFWNERVNHIVQVKADWDIPSLSENETEIRIVDNESRLGRSPIEIFEGSLYSVCGLVILSRKWHCNLRIACGLMILGGIASLVLVYGQALAISLYILSLFWISKNSEVG